MQKIPTLEEVNLNDCFDKCIENFQSQIQMKNLSINKIIQANIPNVISNKTLITFQIFSNIISNAIKFSPQGASIEFGIMSNENQLTAWFEDSGKGMTQEMFQHLEMYNSLPSTEGTNGEQGTGLGILVMFAIAKPLNIEIQYKNNPKGSGTRVELFF